MRLIEIAEKNQQKLREVGRKVASKLTKLQIAVIAVIISLFLVYLGFFRFGQFLRDVVFIISFAAIAGQIGYALYSHAAKYARNKKEKVAPAYEDETWDGEDEEPVGSPIVPDYEADPEPESTAARPAGVTDGPATSTPRRRNPYRRFPT